METRLDRYKGARETKIYKLRELIDQSENIVFLGGAGVSTESGIPDFRSGDGIYNQESGLAYRAVDVISHSFFMEHPEEFYDSTGGSFFILMQSLTRLIRLLQGSSVRESSWPSLPRISISSIRTPVRRIR